MLCNIMMITIIITINDNYINDHNDINDNSIQLKSRPNIYIYIYIYTPIYIYTYFFLFFFLER